MRSEYHLQQTSSYKKSERKTPRVYSHEIAARHPAVLPAADLQSLIERNLKENSPAQLASVSNQQDFICLFSFKFDWFPP